MKSGTWIFGALLKFPEAGKVKTRIARKAGDAVAAALCRALAERVILNTRPVGKEYERVIFYSPEYRRPDFEEWLPGERLFRQRGGDIGEIMSNALADLFSRGATRAVITGVDLPDLDTDIITLAFSKLDSAEIVIGPALDGGYYLLGMRSPHPEIFHGITWGTGEVFGETVSAIAREGLTFDTVPPLSDVDRPEDLRRWPDLEKLWAIGNR